MASKAQLRYAESIVRYFDRHPEHGVDLTVDEVLDNMDLWVARHKLAKEGRPWLSDVDRAKAEAEIRHVAQQVLAAHRAHNRAVNEMMRRRGSTADAYKARDELTETRRQARAILEQLITHFGEQHRREIEDLGYTTGALA